MVDSVRPVRRVFHGTELREPGDVLELGSSIPFGLPGKKKSPLALPLTRLRRAGQFDARDSGLLAAIPGEL